MNNIVSTALSTGGMSLGERLSNGLTVFVTGILAVFGVLAVLWGVLALFKIFFYDIPEKKKAEAKKKAEQSEIAPVTVGAAEETEAPTEEDDTQLIAVITAAIAAYRSSAEASAEPALPFRVVSYKRVRGACGWNGADENETI